MANLDALLAEAEHTGNYSKYDEARADRNGRITEAAQQWAAIWSDNVLAIHLSPRLTDPEMFAVVELLRALERDAAADTWETEHVD